MIHAGGMLYSFCVIIEPPEKHNTSQTKEQRTREKRDIARETNTPQTKKHRLILL